MRTDCEETKEKLVSGMAEPISIPLDPQAIEAWSLPERKRPPSRSTGVAILVDGWESGGSCGRFDHHVPLHDHRSRNSEPRAIIDSAADTETISMETPWR